ncbi:MAG: hypothetical protein ACOYOS_17355 [Syntrophales bacterium]
MVGACFLGGVTDNRHLDAFATINEFATHQKFCHLKKQALGTVKSVPLLHLGQHCARARVKKTIDFIFQPIEGNTKDFPLVICPGNHVKIDDSSKVVTPVKTGVQYFVTR